MIELLKVRAGVAPAFYKTEMLKWSFRSIWTEYQWKIK
jgi:hypothetical protein